MAAAMAAISMVVVMHWSVRRGFLRYVNAMEKAGVSRLASSLEEGYRPEGGWGFVVHDPARWHQLILAAIPPGGPLPQPSGTPPPPKPNGAGQGPPPGPPPHMVRSLDQRLFLLDAERRVLIGHAVPAGSAFTPLFHRGQVVGYLGLLPRQELSGPPQERFLREQRLAFALVAGIIILLATGLSLLLSRRLVRPLRGLAAATHQLAAGRFATRVAVISQDELGQLAGNFNTLAMTLERNEQARRQWVADISHELRTPVAILRGEIEALVDGIRQPDPPSLASLHSEVLRLARLVDDLYQLAMSDLGALTYRKEYLDPVRLLKEMVTTRRAEFAAKGIAMHAELPPEQTVALFGDGERLSQLFANLFTNALKYTEAPGVLRITMGRHAGRVVIDFVDSSPGVVEADLARLFERLYRVDGSRSRATGGAGLGLAICRNIVEAHQGKISARPSPMGGLWVRVELPLAEGR